MQTYEVSDAENMSNCSGSYWPIPVQGYAPAVYPSSQCNVAFWPTVPVAEPQSVLVSYPCPVGAYPAEAWTGAMPQGMIVTPAQMPCMQYVTYTQAACGPMVNATSDGPVQDRPADQTLTEGWEWQPEEKVTVTETLAAADMCVAEAADAWVMEEQRSVASSNCSTAPSTRRKRKPRAPPAERKALAEKHKLVENMAQTLLENRSSLTKQLEAGGDASTEAIERIQGAAWRLSMDVNGCRLVQLAIEKAKGPKRTELCEELKGHVREAMGSPHANYVLQKVVEVMPIEIAGFIAEELSGIAADACKHRYGCRIVCRLTEQFSTAPCVAKLLEEMMKSISELATHTFGHHVVHSVLEHGTAKHKHLIVKVLLKDVMNNATNRSGSSVIERALMHCCDADIDMLVGELLSCDILSLAQTQFGIFVVRGLLDMSGETADKVRQCLESASEDVQANKHYQRLWQLLEDDQPQDVNYDDNA